MKDQGLETALRLASQDELVKAIEALENNKVDALLATQSEGFAEDRNLHNRVCNYVRSLGKEVSLVPDGKPVLHPLPSSDEE